MNKIGKKEEKREITQRWFIDFLLIELPFLFCFEEKYLEIISKVNFLNSHEYFKYFILTICLHFSFKIALFLTTNFKEMIEKIIAELRLSNWILNFTMFINYFFYFYVFCFGNAAIIEQLSIIVEKPFWQELWQKVIENSWHFGTSQIFKKVNFRRSESDNDSYMYFLAIMIIILSSFSLYRLAKKIFKKNEQQQ